MKLWFFSCGRTLTKLKILARTFSNEKVFYWMIIFNIFQPPGIRGDELTLHLLCNMHGIHYCIITKTQIQYSHPTAFPSPSTVHITLVYLGGKVFRDTTKKAMKSPPLPHIEFNEPLPGHITPREACLKNRNEQNLESDPESAESTQESDKIYSDSNTKSGSSQYNQEFQEQESCKCE